VHHPESPFVAARFDHRQHVRFAWAAQRESPGIPGGDVVAREIAEFAAMRAPGLYHETLTRFWVELVQHTISRCSNAADFELLVQEFPLLLDKRAPAHHYSQPLLQSDQARTAWVTPDLLPMP
jgi:hypothetical protein